MRLASNVLEKGNVKEEEEGGREREREEEIATSQFMD